MSLTCVFCPAKRRNADRYAAEDEKSAEGLPRERLAEWRASSRPASALYIQRFFLPRCNEAQSGGQRSRNQSLPEPALRAFSGLRLLRSIPARSSDIAKLLGQLEHAQALLNDFSTCVTASLALAFGHCAVCSRLASNPNSIGIK
jgi:hypothetical protein